MANNYSINANQLTPETRVLITGRTTYSRLAKLVEGAELAKADAMRKGNPINRPYTICDLAGAEVLFADAANPTLEELFVSERRFVSNKYPERGQCYSMIHKSTNLPVVGKKNDAGEVEQIFLEGDLAADLQVTLVLRVYKPKDFANCGLSLDLVLLEEPLRYYNAGVSTAELAARGIVFATPPKQVAGKDVAANVTVNAGGYPEGGLPANTDPATGLPAPAMAAVAPTAPVMHSAPAPAAQMAQPASMAQQPVVRAETPDEELARLRAQVASQNTAAAHSGGASAFGDAPAPAVNDGNPWNPEAKQPVGQGISYSG